MGTDQEQNKQVDTATEVIEDPIPDEDFYETSVDEGKGIYHARFLAFNTVIDVQLYLDGGADAKKLADESFSLARELCRHYERLFSRWLPHSDIARINASQGEPVTIAPETARLLQLALHYCAESEGVFDITIGSTLRLWDFHEGIVPDAASLQEALIHVNWRNLHVWNGRCQENLLCSENSSESLNSTFDGKKELSQPNYGEKNDNGEVFPEDRPNSAGSPPYQPIEIYDDGYFANWYAQLDDPQAMVDVGGIAKGWIADELTKTLVNLGLEVFFINLGGNVVVHGTKSDGSPWKVGIRDPQAPSQLIATAAISGGSAVTSGVYERCFTKDGKKYHHILNPKTGMPADTDIAGVTVIAEKSIDAEGYSTTLLALGLERADLFVKNHPEIVQALFVTNDERIFAARG